mmetsp:Transcript_54596/g.119077  ORF Transcript_54596/g.119077 Transcript_54596/m.119077 type:complete len:420 (-) Transcript_54596:756-2015(-)
MSRRRRLASTSPSSPPPTPPSPSPAPSWPFASPLSSSSHSSGCIAAATSTAAALQSLPPSFEATSVLRSCARTCVRSCRSVARTVASCSCKLSASSSSSVSSAPPAASLSPSVAPFPPAFGEGSGCQLAASASTDKAATARFNCMARFARSRSVRVSAALFAIARSNIKSPALPRSTCDSVSAERSSKYCVHKENPHLRASRLRLCRRRRAVVCMACTLLSINCPWLSAAVKAAAAAVAGAAVEAVVIAEAAGVSECGSIALSRALAAAKAEVLVAAAVWLHTSISATHCASLRCPGARELPRSLCGRKVWIVDINGGRSVVAEAAAPVGAAAVSAAVSAPAAAAWPVTSLMPGFAACCLRTMARSPSSIVAASFASALRCACGASASGLAKAHTASRSACAWPCCCLVARYPPRASAS